MPESSGDICALIELIAKSLVDAPDEVFVEKFDEDLIGGVDQLLRNQLDKCAHISGGLRHTFLTVDESGI